MRIKAVASLAAAAVLAATAAVLVREASGSPSGRVERCGMVIGVKPDKIEYYKKLHAAAWPGVLAKIKECNIRNYSIYLREIEKGIGSGIGKPEDIALLEELAVCVSQASLCDLGKSAPQVVVSTLRHFRGEYETHIVDQVCPVKRCSM